MTKAFLNTSDWDICILNLLYTSAICIPVNTHEKTAKQNTLEAI